MDPQFVSVGRDGDISLGRSYGGVLLPNFLRKDSQGGQIVFDLLKRRQTRWSTELS